MNRDQEAFFERLAKCIDTCQKIHNDARTPLNDALSLVEHIRTLNQCRRVLRKESFRDAITSNSKFSSATLSLEKINNTLKADIMAHNRTLGFVNDAATAAAAVLDLAIGVGALAA